MASSIEGSGTSGRPTFSGLASGLDTSALVESLLAIQREPLNRLEARRDDVADQQDLMRELNTKLLSLRDAAREVDNRSLLGNSESTDEEFLSYKSESTDEDVVTASVSNGATPGSLDLTVQQLASFGRQFSSTFATSDTASIAAGSTIRIDLNDGDPLAVPPIDATTLFDHTVGQDGLTLAGLKEMINSDENNEDKLTAEIVQISEDEFRLVLTAKEEGVDSDFTLTGDAVAMDASLAQAATNAEFTLSGLSLSRNSNTIDDVLEGVTFELNAASDIENLALVNDDPNAGPIVAPIYETTSIEIGVDNEEIATTIESFLTKFNDVMTFINKQQKVDEATKRNGPLGNDSTLRTIKARLIDTVSRRFEFSAAPNNPFTSPGSIGLEFEGGGKLSLDKEKLGEALDRNTLAVRRLFAGAPQVDENGEVIQVPRRDGNGDIVPDSFVDGFDDGLATGIGSLLKPIVRVGDGLLAIRDQGFSDRLDGFDGTIDRFNRRLAKRQDTLVAQFTRLEQIVASFNAQSSFLSGLR
ncbi:MAG: flagellar hook-associated protein 2 [Planctomycetota bacterium]|jgi:flagellar hook-associated protein 2